MAGWTDKGKSNAPSHKVAAQGIKYFDAVEKRNTEKKTIFKLKSDDNQHPRKKY
jgi:hypothetical protein